MRRIILAGSAFGLAVALTHSLLAAIVAAVVTYAVTQGKAATKMVMIHDFETGETRAQPMDRETERYINSRTRKDG
jgi:hypothetical protein